MKLCRKNNCFLKHYAKGYCYKHYLRICFRWYSKALSHGSWKKRGICKEKNCHRGIYAKSVCKKHYSLKTQKRIHGNRKKCVVKNCKRMTAVSYCFFHKKRLDEGKPLNNRKLPLIGTRKGSKCYFWKGGIAEYKNHALMKRNRLKKLKEQNYKCQDCKKSAKYAHHLDFKKTNHSFKNLISLCCRCHLKRHRIHSREELNNSR